MGWAGERAGRRARDDVWRRGWEDSADKDDKPCEALRRLGVDIAMRRSAATTTATTTSDWYHGTVIWTGGARGVA